tara:strand:+ start:118 stop:327 length:210 start_codon:yes stop_codon:yes gene_type:complete
MPTAKEIIKKAHKEGKISTKQMKGLPEPLLLGIAKKGDAKGGIKENEQNPMARLVVQKQVQRLLLKNED